MCRKKTNSMHTKETGTSKYVQLEKMFCDSTPVILQVKSFDALVGLLTCSIFFTPSQLISQWQSV